MKLAAISKVAVTETQARLQRFAQTLRNAARHPDDPETIHHLRVSIRRLSQCLTTFRDLLDPLPVKKLRRRLRKLMDLCAAVRNCDVALALLQQVGIAAGAPVAKLQWMREEAAEKLHRRLKKERQRHGVTIRASFRPPVGNWNLDQSPEDNLRGILPMLAEEFFDAGNAAAVTGASSRILHQFRLRAKRFRYTLELFERFYGSEMARAAQALKVLQDRLGAINDCVTTIDLLGRDRRAVAAVRKLQGERTREFQRYWRSQFAPRRRAGWKRWLARPAGDTS